MTQVIAHELETVIRHRHGGTCEFLRVSRVKKAYKGRILWRGEVATFRLTGSGEERTCYGWIEDALLGVSEPVLMLADDRVNSPTAAVTRHMLSLCESA